MILQELVDLARREGLVEDPDFEPKEVRWILTVGPGGKFLGETEPPGFPDARGKIRPKVIQVPRTPPRANNPPPAFLVDTAEFVLGYDPAGKRDADVLKGRNQAFAEYVARALALAPNDEGLRAVFDFLRDEEQKALCLVRLKGRLTSQDKFAFKLPGDDGSVQDRPAVRDAWRGLRQEVSRGESTCLSCGKMAPVTRLHPQIGLIPGAAKPIPIISFNQSAFDSLGFEGNENAPICQACADAYGTALSRLFHPRYSAPDGRTLDRRTFRLSDDTGVIYWSSGAAEHGFVNELGYLDFEEAEKAGTLFEAVHAGKGDLLNDRTLFHALIVTGGQGRATLRSYHQSTVGEVAANLDKYFEDIEIVRRFPNSPRWPPLSWLIRSLAAQGKFENVAPDLAGRLFLAILDGKPFPVEVLSASIGRIRSEPEKPDQGKHKHTRERLALIRATLNRSKDDRIRELIPKEIPPVLDETYDDCSYCLGRLFAVLERLQSATIGKPNATITDRFYGAASATPVAVFPTLLRKSQFHLASLRKKKITERLAKVYEKRISNIMDLLKVREEPFPSTLRLEQQGLFALGYYQQKNHRPEPRQKLNPIAAPKPSA